MLRKEEILERTSNGLAIFKHYLPGNWRIGRNFLNPLEKETFRLYYTSASTDQQTIDIYIIDSFGQMQQLSFSFNNDNSEKGTETITP